MTTAILLNPWFDLMDAATERALSPESKRARRNPGLELGPSASVSVGDVYMGEALEALLQAYAEASQPDWDGHGARPVLESTAIQALAFLKLVPSAFSRAEVTAHPDGELAFEWSVNPRRILTVSINGSGVLSYAALIGYTQQHGTEFLLDELPESIALALRRVHSAT